MGRRFVDARWLHQRQDAKTNRLAREQAGRVAIAPARYCVGDTVEVLRACRLPQVEEVLGRGTVERITNDTAPLSEWLYWVGGFPCARSSRELRLVLRGGGR
jgi:hypothetical protein